MCLMTPREQKLTTKPKKPAATNKYGLSTIIPQASFSRMCLNSNAVAARRRKSSEAGEMKYIPSHMLNFLFASKNCMHAFLNASVNSAPKIKANPTHVKLASPRDAINVPPIITATAMATLVCHLSNPVRYKMTNNTAGDSALTICKNDSVR